MSENLINNIESVKKQTKSKDKLIIYDHGANGVFRVIADFAKLRNVVRKLEEYQYVEDKSIASTNTYLEYILKAFLAGVDDEMFKPFSITTHERNSNNIINCILKYEQCGELDSCNEGIISFSKRGGNFDINKLRGLYEIVKESIKFVNIITGEEIDFIKMQELAFSDESDYSNGVKGLC